LRGDGSPCSISAVTVRALFCEEGYPYKIAPVFHKISTLSHHVGKCAPLDGEHNVKRQF